MDEEDHFHKNFIQKKPKLEQKILKSTPQATELNDSKRHTDQFQRGVYRYLHLTN